MKTDTELKQLLAKMLPDKVGYHKSIASIQGDRDEFLWLDTDCDRLVFSNRKVLDTELLHLCWLVESKLADTNYVQYTNQLRYICIEHAITLSRYQSATWQQRVTALSKVKGLI